MNQYKRKIGEQLKLIRCISISKSLIWKCKQQLQNFRWWCMEKKLSELSCIQITKFMPMRNRTILALYSPSIRYRRRTNHPCWPNQSDYNSRVRNVNWNMKEDSKNHIHFIKCILVLVSLILLHKIETPGHRPEHFKMIIVSWNDNF